MLLNVTTRDGQDVTAYGATPLSDSFSASIVGGIHRQSEEDVDSDGWIDIPGYERWTIRPRLFWEGEDGANGFVTIGAMNEDRQGGTLQGRVTPDGLPFPNTQESERYDGGFVGELPLALGTAHLRASTMKQDHSHVFGAVTENDTHETSLAEVSFSAQAGDTSWLAGVAVQEDGFSSDTFPEFDYTDTTPG